MYFPLIGWLNSLRLGYSFTPVQWCRSGCSQSWVQLHTSAVVQIWVHAVLNKSFTLVQRCGPGCGLCQAKGIGGGRVRKLAQDACGAGALPQQLQGGAFVLPACEPSGALCFWCREHAPGRVSALRQSAGAAGLTVSCPRSCSKPRLCWCRGLVYVWR